jgi:hypothetical protein
VTRSQKRMIVSRRVPSNRGLAAVEIIQQNFGVKVMEQRDPPEIGEMVQLEIFDIYTSYRLHWLVIMMGFTQTLPPECDAP